MLWPVSRIGEEVHDVTRPSSGRGLCGIYSIESFSALSSSAIKSSDVSWGIKEMTENE